MTRHINAVVHSHATTYTTAVNYCYYDERTMNDEKYKVIQPSTDNHTLL